MNIVQAVHYLGKRVVLADSVGEYSRGRTGLLVSLQSGHERGSGGDPYATVNFDLLDWSAEENVPLQALRPMIHKR